VDIEFIRGLTRRSETKIVLLVLDGLGGLERRYGDQTELTVAHTPNLDDLAVKSICGLHQPVGPGITPGSGPAHLALFGYDPIRYTVGRGVLAALGIRFELAKGDIAARGNFCTLREGKVTDRRAGRISTEMNKALCERLNGIEVPGAELFVETVKEHRFLLVLRGNGLSSEIGDTDPQQTGVEPLPARPLAPAARESVLDGEERANMVILRGFSSLPDWPTMGEAYGLRAAAVASYPMYLGLARLIGMEAFSTGSAVADIFSTAAEKWDDFDFFYLHVKGIDSAGEDGDFERKAGLIDEVDRLLPHLLRLKPDVLVVTGDHSTPAVLRSHSWHPVPVLLWSQYCRPDAVERFDERSCVSGALGCRLPATDLMPIALANAGRLQKYGA
jgi:2,3-bisphosphoglycerate-independent phosphoglycerate mutase